MRFIGRSRSCSPLYFQKPKSTECNKQAQFGAHRFCESASPIPRFAIVRCMVTSATSDPTTGIFNTDVRTQSPSEARRNLQSSLQRETWRSMISTCLAWIRNRCCLKLFGRPKCKNTLRFCLESLCLGNLYGKWDRCVYCAYWRRKMETGSEQSA